MTLSRTQAKIPAFSGRQTLVVLLGAFAIVGLVNAVFVWAAVSTFSGLDGEDGYRRGLAYNDTLAEAAAQKQLGWHVALNASGGNSLQLVLTDTRGEPINGLAISGTLGRPAVSQFDRPLAFAPKGPGRYEARLSATGKGTWIVSLNVTGPGTGSVFRWKERLWLSPAG